MGHPLFREGRGGRATRPTYLNNLSYNAAGEPLGLTLGNGVQGAFTYNDHLQLASLRYSMPGAASDALNLQYDYGASNNGQIQSVRYYTAPGMEDTTKSQYFTYDLLGRLSAAHTGQVNSTAGTWALAWSYDRWGNRLSQTLSGGNVAVGQPNLTIDSATNRITNTGVAYDPAGNMTNDGANAYTFDGANRMTQVGSNAAAYTYFGPLRIKKVNGNATTVYIYSGTKPIVEYLNGSVSKEYIYAGSQLVATVAGSAITYHHPDHLSNRAETDGSGNVIRTFGHLPFGESWYETGTTDKWKFTSYERDSATGDTGLDYAQFRLYSSGLGRFMSADLMGGDLRNPQSGNLYSYVLNDPTNLIDPLGLACTGTVTIVVTPSGTSWGAWIVGCDGTGAGGGRVTNTVEQPPPDDSGGGLGTEKKPSKDCLHALRVAGADAAALTRVANNSDAIQSAAAANGIDPNLLAAIAIRETGFRNIPQTGGGQGAGVFQIDLGQNPSVKSAQAYDVTFAANFAANMLAMNIASLAADHPNLNPTQLLQATAASYNFGTGNISGNPTTIDVGSTGNNYGQNVLDIMQCF